MTTTKRQPIAYSGEGSAIANYMSAAPVETPKVENWGAFTAKKPDPAKRKKLFSLLHQAKWTIDNLKYGKVPDLERLSDFLKSEKSPVNKKLVDMDTNDMKKIIGAFNGIVLSKFK